MKINRFHLIILVGVVMFGMFTVTLTAGQTQSIYWEGQTAEISDGIDPSTTYNLYTDDGDTFETQVASNSSGVLTIDTADYGTGKFVVEDQNGNNVAEYSVNSQNLNVESDKTIIYGDGEVEFTIKSARVEFDMYLQSDDADDQDLLDSLQVDSNRKSVTQDDGVLIENIQQGEKIRMKSDPLPNGGIDLLWNVTDTVDQEEIRIVAESADADDVDFEGDPYRDEIGDPIEAELSLDRGRTVTVDIGDEGGDDDYNHEVVLEDTDEDGDVFFTLDTYGVQNPRPAEAGDGTEILNQETEIEPDDVILDEDRYDMTASVQGNEMDTTSMRLRDLDADDIKIRSLRESSDLDKEDIIDNSNERRSIARRDYLVLVIETSSVHSFIDDSTDPEDLEDDSSLSGEFDAYLQIEDEDEDEIESFSEADRVLTDEPDNEIYFVMSAEELTDETSGDNDDDVDVFDSYDAEFVIEDDSPLTDSRIDIDTDGDIDIVENTIIPDERQADIGFNREDPYVFDLQSGEIESETTLADGSEVTVVIDGQNIDRERVGEFTVEDEEIEFELNTANLDIGDEFTIEFLETDETYQFVAGVDNAIRTVNAPDSVREDTEFDIDVRLRNQFQDVDVRIRPDGKRTIFGTEATLTYDDPETYRIEVEATGSQGAISDTRTITVEILRDIPQPIVNIEDADDGAVFTGEEARFSARETAVSNSQIDYIWRIDGRQIGDSRVVRNQFQRSGTYNVSVEVTNQQGESDSTSVLIRVYDGNEFAGRIFDFWTQ